jgi:hypothetical protein
MGRTFRPKTKINPRGAGRRKLPEWAHRKSINITLHPDDFPKLDALIAEFNKGKTDKERKITRSTYISNMIRVFYSDIMRLER